MNDWQDEYTTRWYYRKPKAKRQQGFQEKVLRKLGHIEKELHKLMTDITEVTAALENLKTDLEAKAAEATAEFEKLEKELEEAGHTADLTPLKDSIEGIDAAVKAAVVPTN